MRKIRCSVAMRLDGCISGSGLVSLSYEAIYDAQL